MRIATERIQRLRGNLELTDEAKEKAVAGLRAAEELCEQGITLLRTGEKARKEDEQELGKKFRAAEAQKDEWDKLRRDMPGPDFRLALRVPREEIPAITHPLTKEVIDAVTAYRKIGEIVDHCPYPDYQVLRVLSDLFARDALGLEHLRTTPEGGFAQSEAAVFSAAQVRRLREWAASQRP